VVGHTIADLGLCPSICHAAQTLIQSGQGSLGNGKRDTVVAKEKRFFLDSVGINFTKYAEQLLADLGADETEQQCEAQCPSVVGHTIADLGLCPSICHAAQTLIQSGQGSLGAGKRDTAQLIKSYVDTILKDLGSDATEQELEKKCTELTGPLSFLLCPEICQAVQKAFDTDDKIISGRKRFVFGSFNISDLIAVDEMNRIIHEMVAVIGADPTELICETECNNVLQGDTIRTLCPFICKSFQALVQHYDPGAVKEKRMLFTDIMNGLDITSLLDKLLRVFDASSLLNKLNAIVDQVGSDDTEAACEAACHDVITNPLIDTLCPLICKSMQNLTHMLHVDLASTVAPAQAKRFLFNSSSIFNYNSLIKLVDPHALYVKLNEIVDLAGSDATEAKLEVSCREVMNSALLDEACPFICTSIQSLIQRLHIQLEDSTTVAPMAKRFLFGNLTSIFNLNTLTSLIDTHTLYAKLNEIVDMVGSDASKASCVDACMQVMKSAILDQGCGYICDGTQSLIQQLHIEINEASTVAPAAPDASAAKRFLFDEMNLHTVMQIIGANSLDDAVNIIVNQVGSDASEAECQTACVSHASLPLPDLTCPVVCSSLQQLINGFHITEANSTAPAS